MTSLRDQLQQLASAADRAGAPPALSANLLTAALAIELATTPAERDQAQREAALAIEAFQGWRNRRHRAPRSNPVGR
jgi:hypothetical protein